MQSNIFMQHARNLLKRNHNDPHISRIFYLLSSKYFPIAQNQKQISKKLSLVNEPSKTKKTNDLVTRAYFCIIYGCVSNHIKRRDKQKSSKKNWTRKKHFSSKQTTSRNNVNNHNFFLSFCLLCHSFTFYYQLNFINLYFHLLLFSLAAVATRTIPRQKNRSVRFFIAILLSIFLFFFFFITFKMHFIKVNWTCFLFLEKILPFIQKKIICLMITPCYVCLFLIDNYWFILLSVLFYHNVNFNGAGRQNTSFLTKQSFHFSLQKIK